MNKRCHSCELINYVTETVCSRCGCSLNEKVNIPSKRRISKSSFVHRAAICLVVLCITLLGFYSSLVLSADPLTADERAQVTAAIKVLEAAGFSDEVFMLRHLAVYRANDNWLNASVEKESAYAATNFPFQIITVYPDFFVYPVDDVERAAILLHEAQHLYGADEKEAYEFVWKNRAKLGWTSKSYAGSTVWRETQKLTKEYTLNIFVCDFKPYDDCTE